MADSKQLRILKALTVLFEGITPANGFDYDLRGKVFRGKTQFGADESVPLVSILEALRPDQQPLFVGNERLMREESWELLVQGFAGVSREFPTDELYNLKASVEKRLAQVFMENSLGDPAFPLIYRLGGLATSILIGPGVVRAAMPQQSGTEAFYLPVHVGYVINMADPWA